MPNYHVIAQTDEGTSQAGRAQGKFQFQSQSNVTNSHPQLSPSLNPRTHLALDSMSNICIMPENIALHFVHNKGWIRRKLKRQVHMGASSHDNTIVLRDIVINPANDYQPAFYVAPTGTMTICSTDYISRLGLIFTILPHRGGFVIKQPTGRVLYQGETAADQFHYISFSTFDELKPVKSISSSRLVRQIDMHDFISDVVDELDSEDKRLHDEQSTKLVNSLAKDHHIPADIVRIIRDSHVRYAHMNAADLAVVLARGARADIPSYTPQQVLKVMERWPCIFCRAASARIGSRGRGSGVHLSEVAIDSQLTARMAFNPACTLDTLVIIFLRIIVADFCVYWVISVMMHLI